MLTEKDYCDYETCVALKESGFNEYCSGYMDSLCKTFIETRYLKRWNSTKRSDFEVFSCPSLYEAQKWLREERHIEVVVLSIRMTGAPYYFQVYTEDYVTTDDNNYNSYEEALSEGVKEAVKILKEYETILR